MGKKDQEKLAQFLLHESRPDQLFKRLHSFEGRLAQFITNFAGSMYFVYFHVVWFSAWIVLNHKDIPFAHPFDPFPYGLLTMVVSLEAIFLSTFIMLNQNRQALVDTYRELEDQQEQQEEEQQQEELEEDVEDIQKNLDDIRDALIFIQQKINKLDRGPHSPSTPPNPNLRQ